jgi:putative transcriptional regulator
MNERGEQAVRHDRVVSDVVVRGRLLVAAPPLVDPNFDRTVVLMLEHGPEGALGLVLNRPGDTELVDAIPEWGEMATLPAVVFAGGPVSPESVIALARSDTPDERDGWVPVGGGFGTVDLARAPDEVGAAIDGVRVFVGYAGWAPGQLEEELAHGAWFVVDFELDDAFGLYPEHLWRRVLRRQRGRLAIFANCPDDPSTN